MDGHLVFQDQGNLKAFEEISRVFMWRQIFDPANMQEERARVVRGIITL